MGGSESANGCARFRDWVDAPSRLGVSAIDPESRPVARWVIARSLSGPSDGDVDSDRDRHWVMAGRRVCQKFCVRRGLIRVCQKFCVRRGLILAAWGADRFRGRRPTSVARHASTLAGRRKRSP
jgi:hypothetical protein